MRLIDADALGMDMWIQIGIVYGEDTGKAFADIVRNAPTIDAEPIVRCKDCRYNTDNPRLFYSKDMIVAYAWCSMIIDTSNGEGFCNFAKDLKSEEKE